MFLLRWVRVGVAMLWLAPPPSASFSRGASPASCREMTPGHIRAHPQDPRHGYVIVRTSAASYRPGQLVTVTVRSSRDFMGFLLQARGAAGGNGSLAGTWALTPPGAHTLRCAAAADAVTHSDKQLKRNLSFVWRAPDAPSGDVRFHITVVQSYFVYWASIQSGVLRDGSRRSAAVRSQARETFTLSVPPDPNRPQRQTNQQTTRRPPTRRSTRSHQDVSTRSHQDVSSRSHKDVSSRSHQDVSTRSLQEVSSRSHQDVSSRSHQDVSSRSHQDVSTRSLQEVSSRSHQDVSRSHQDVSSRSHQDVSTRSLQEVSSRSHQDVSTRSLQDVSSRSHQDLSSRSHQDVSTRSLQEVSSRSHQDVSTRSLQDVSSRSHQDLSSRSHQDVSTKSRVPPVAPDEERVSSLTTPRREISGWTSGVTDEGRTEDTEPPIVQETKYLIQELEGLVPPRWFGPAGTQFKMSSPSPIRPSRGHTPLFQWRVSSEDDLRGTSPTSGSSTWQTPPPSLGGSRVSPGTGAPKMVDDAQSDRSEPAPEPSTEPVPLSPNGTLKEGTGLERLDLDYIYPDASSASTNVSSSSFTSCPSSVGSSSENSFSTPTTDRPRTAAALLKVPTPSPIHVPVRRLPVQPRRPTEDPSPASVRPASPPPGPSPVPRRSLNAAVASSPVPLASRRPAAGQRPTTRRVPTSAPDPPARTEVHLNPKPHPNLKVRLDHGAKPDVPNGRPEPPPEAPDKDRKYPDIVPRHSDWELGMLLACSAGLGMALVVALRYVYRQACGGRTGVTLNDREREYPRGERHRIHVQECGDLVRVRKIRDNSFVLLAEYDILAAPAD